MPDRPRRIQLRRTKGWRKPEGAIVVARPSKWGNPFRVGPTVLAYTDATQGDVLCYGERETWHDFSFRVDLSTGSDQASLRARPKGANECLSTPEQS